MDPATVTAAFGILNRVFNVGLSAYKAREKWGLSVDEAEALQKLASAGGQLAGLFGSGAGAPPPRLSALHTALVTRAFGVACSQHWAGNAAMAPGLQKASWLRRRFLSKAEGERVGEIETRLRMALGSPAAPEQGGAAKGFDVISAMIDDPLGSPVYQALWRAFTNPQLDEGEQARLIELDDPGARLEFERFFRLAYAEAISSPGGADLARGMVELSDSRPRLLRELIVRSVSTWKSRHVFGSKETPGVPTMPMGEIYVEPYGTFREKKDGLDFEERKPIRTLVRELLVDHKIVVVRGDFGQGKSLTARTLACEWAEAYLTDKTTPSTKLFYPVFIRCGGGDFPNHEPAFVRIVKLALQRQARELGVDLGEEDEAIANPPRTDQTVYIIDGLDEVALTSGEVESFFKNLDTYMGGTRRAVVLSRKGMIPAHEKLRGVPIVDVEQLRTKGDRPGGQVGEWIERWNKLSGREPVEVDQIRADLLEIAQTPILLFMIAVTWDPERAKREKVSRAEIYEQFFQQIAAGKCAQDEYEHPLVADASRQLLEQLGSKGFLVKADLPRDSTRARALAMLWMLARVSWEWRRLAARGDELTLHEVTTLLREELEIKGDPSMLETVKVGVLLALQADQQGGQDRVLFGHKSFREFLVARYWADRLQRLLAERHDRRDQYERDLLGARLLDPEETGTIEFLMEIVNGPTWTNELRARLVDWAEDCFNNEEPLFPGPRAHSWSDDQRPVLREAALAIGSLVTDSRKIHAKNPQTLRSILGWFWAQSKTMSVDAPGLVSPHANLDGANLFGANLERANLERANLTEANLFGANLELANLVAATLVRANFVQAYLACANLDSANLFRANLVGAHLVGANLFRANLAEAPLDSASLTGANLAEATLYSASLTDANLVGANLGGANLGGANLVGANLHEANLELARSTADTQWPEGFDPHAAGVRFLAASPDD